MRGPRSEAFKDFKNAIRNNPAAICLLLVDSEGSVEAGVSPWDHVASRAGDGWQQPAGVTDEQLHFMVQEMESWIVADPEALLRYYGSEFKANKLPRRPNLEQVSKADLEKALEAATKDTRTKGPYQKAHGFELIGMINPTKVRRACPGFAERFFKELETRAR